MTARERADGVVKFFAEHPDADQRDGIMFAIQAAVIDERQAIAEEVQLVTSSDGMIQNILDAVVILVKDRGQP